MFWRKNKKKQQPDHSLQRQRTSKSFSETLVQTLLGTGTDKKPNPSDSVATEYGQVRGAAYVML